MRLTKITLWNFRSFWSDDHNIPSGTLPLSANVNYLAGPNNVGKSNILRAVALALDPYATFVQDVDRPHAGTWGPGVELEFHVGSNPTGAIKKLLDEIDAYERTIPSFTEPSLAAGGVIRFYVEYDSSGARDERFLTRGTWDRGKVVGRNNKRQRAVERFHEAVRYVDIKSGEDLESLLQRGFEEILASAVGSGHTKEMEAAREAREAYVDALGRVLRPVAKHVQDRINRYVRGIEEVDLVPDVPGVEKAIADARVFLKDSVRTALEQKGTGVRGAMLLLLLSFIADSAKSAVVFGIEEPEAFLHPETHRELGTGLEHFTRRSDVTMLVTTHSPFIFRSGVDGEQAAVFQVAKDEAGRSSVKRGTPKAVRADLFGSGELSDLLEKIERVPDDAKLLLVVEGVTDQSYLQLASRYLGIPLGDVHILYRGGAGGAVLEAVALGARHAPGRAVAALFDSDETGAESYKLLAERFAWKKKSGDRLYVLSYEKWFDGHGVPVEAEELFANATIEAFLAAAPENEGFMTEKVKRKKAGTWHYGLDGAGKIALVKWLEENGDEAMFGGWRPVLLHLRALADGVA